MKGNKQKCWVRFHFAYLKGLSPPKSMERTRNYLNSSGSNMNGSTHSNQAAIFVELLMVLSWARYFFIFYVKDLPNVLEFALLLLVC